MSLNPPNPIPNRLLVLYQVDSEHALPSVPAWFPKTLSKTAGIGGLKA